MEKVKQFKYLGKSIISVIMFSIDIIVRAVSLSFAMILCKKSFDFFKVEKHLSAPAAVIKHFSSLIDSENVVANDCHSSSPFSILHSKGYDFSDHPHYRGCSDHYHFY